MARLPLRLPVRWRRSFYWRLGTSLVVIVLAVLVIQAIVAREERARRDASERRSPNEIAARAAFDLGSALARDPSLNLEAFVDRAYGREPSFYVLMKDGRMASSRPRPLPEGTRRVATAMLNGTDPRPSPSAAPMLGPPVAMAPVVVGRELRGLVLMPMPTNDGLFDLEMSRIVTWPVTLLVLIATIVGTIFIFAPARRRLQALERASQRLGSGDLTARAPEEGGDEIAHVSAAFNRMAAELAARDEALRAADGLRRQMLADVSHELRTPLTAMRASLETVRSPVDADTRERYLEAAEREAGRLERLVRDLFDLVRQQHRVGALDVRLFAVERLFDHVIERHRRDAEARRVALHTHIGDGADQVMADPDRLEQVIDNLVANALRHTPEGGSVQLDASITGSAVRISVTDTGEGIPAEHLAHIFDRFYRVDRRRHHDSGGTGLGLAIARAIVERHHGTIAATSEQGRTAFVVTLPQHDVDASGDQSTSANL